MSASRSTAAGGVDRRHRPARTGAAGWDASLDVLAGRATQANAPTVLVAPPSLPPAERRRVGKGVKVALEVAFEAAAHAGVDPSTLASVFTSSSGDGDNCDAICRELAGDRLISPTRFHNSVHNAPAGYWGIASGSMAPSTSLCAYDDSFVAGLDDALTQLDDDTPAVLLVAYDAPYPEPLRSVRPTPDAFGVALLLARDAGPRSLARIEWLRVADVRRDDDERPVARRVPRRDPRRARAAAARGGRIGRRAERARVRARGRHARRPRRSSRRGAAARHAEPHRMRLNRHEIAALIPHAGRMVLLDEVVEWSDERIVCHSTMHEDRGNPLAVAGRLSAVCGIEFAAQAMAVHGALVRRSAAPDPAKPSAGFLASVRSVDMAVARLDDVPGVLTIEAVREAGDELNVVYRFELRSGQAVLVSGRAAVVLRMPDDPAARAA